MSEKIKILKLRPMPCDPWLYLPFDKDALWTFIGESPAHESWEIEVIEMTEEEYDNLPEFPGW